jgi:hypothetical protein
MYSPGKIHASVLQQHAVAAMPKQLSWNLLHTHLKNTRLASISIRAHNPAVLVHGNPAPHQLANNVLQNISSSSNTKPMR